MMKYTITTVLFVALLSVLQAQIRIELNPELGDCFCEGTPQQPFMVTAEGSAGPFTYEWSSPNGYTSTQKEPADITEAGSYELTVYNAYGCDFSYEVELEACPVPQYNILPNTCRGMLTLEIESGVGPFSVAWFDAVSETPLGETAYTISVQEGTYFAKVTDGNGCVLQTPPVVMAIDPIVIEATTAVSPPSCATATDGSVTATVQSGGTPPYIYNWYDGAFTAIDNPSNVLTGVGAGEYRLVVEDGNGCRSNWVITNVEAAEESDQEAPYVQQVRVYVGEEGAGQTLIYKGWWTNDGTDCLDFNLDESLATDQSTIHRIQQGERIEVQAWTNTGMNALEMGFPGTGVSQSGVSEPLPIGQNVYWEFVFDNGVPNMLQEDSDIVQPLAFEGTSIEGGRPLLDLLQYSADLTACAPVPAQQPDCSWQPALVTGEDRVHEIRIEGCGGLSEPSGNFCPKIGAETDCGAEDGYISFRLCQAFNNPTYEWSNGVTTRDNSWLSSGYYTLTVTDAEGCQGIFEYYVPGYSPSIPVIADDFTVSACSGSDNGEISFFVGDADQLEWDDGLVEALSDPINDVEAYTREGLAAGQYCVSAVNTLSGCSIYKCFQVEENIPVETFEATAEIIEEQCHLQSNGRVQISFSGGQPPYYHNGEALLNYVIGQGYEYATSLEIDGLVEGNYCEDVMDHCGEVIQVCFDMPLNEESVFDIRVVDFIHASTNEENDGRIEVATVPDGNYEIIWYDLNNTVTPLSTSSVVEGLGPGSYMVRISKNGIHCFQERTYQVESCVDALDFNLELAGGFVQETDEETAMVLFVQDENTNGLTASLPNGYTLSWITNATIVNPSPSSNPLILDVNSIEALVDDDRTPFVEAVVSDGCSTKTIRKNLLLCGDTNSAADFFIANERLIKPCVGQSDGGIPISVPAFSSDTDITVSYAINGVTQELSLQQGVLEMHGTIDNAIAGDYIITIEIDDCIMEFSYTLADKPFDVEFFEYDEATEDCIYEESCRGFVYDYSVLNSFKAPYLATSNPCEIPIFCRSNPKHIRVGSKKYEKRLCRGLKYYQLLQGLMSALGTDYANDLGFSQEYLEELRGAYNRQDDCRWVRYCTANMKKIYGIGLGSYATYIGQSVNDCEKYKCPTFLNPNIRICPGENCMKFPGSAAPGIDVDPPEPPCYRYRNANLYGLIYAFEQGWLEDIANTNLYYEISLLATSLNTSDRNRAKCATAYFCVDNYQFLYHTLDEVDCSVVGVPVFENYWELCPGGGAPVLVENCHTATNLINVCETVEELYDENGDLVGELVACRKNCLWEGVDCVEESVIDYGAILAILGIENGLIPTTGEGEEKLNFKGLNDDLLVEKLDDFSFLTFQGVTVPKPMISTEQGRGYYDYVSGRSNVERKVLEPGLLFQNHNWDTNQETYAYQTDTGVKLSYEDSIAVWDIDLHSSQDSFIVLESVSILPDFAGLEIKGSFKGDLYLNDLALANEAQNSVFVISFSTEGQVVDYNIVSNVDRGRHFRGGSEGNSVFVTDYSAENGSIVFEDIIIDAPEESEKGRLIGVWDTEQKDFLYRKKIILPEQVTIAAADFQVDRLAIAIKNAGAIIYDQNDVDKVRVDSVEPSKTMIVRYHPSAIQHNWASTIIEGEGVEHIDIEFTPNGGFFVGLTITDNLLVEGYAIEHIGGKDIAILQYGSSGELIGGNVYGTAGDETVEKLFFNHDRLFFSGIFDGNVIEREIGDYTFRDITPFNAEVYVSEIQVSSAQQLVVSEAVKQVTHSVTDNSTTQLTALYPNPSSGEITIELHSELAQQMDIELTDLMGRTLSKWPGMRLYKGMNKFNISPSSDIATGMYLLKLMPEDSQGRAIISKITRY